MKHAFLVISALLALGLMPSAHADIDSLLEMEGPLRETYIAQMRETLNQKLDKPYTQLICSAAKKEDYAYYRTAISVVKDAYCIKRNRGLNIADDKKPWLVLVAYWARWTNRA